MHAASVERSQRLKRVLEFLESRGERGATSLELANEARTVAPGTCISELRHQGYSIRCEQVKLGDKRVWRYWLTKGPMLVRPESVPPLAKSPELFE